MKFTHHKEIRSSANHNYANRKPFCGPKIFDTKRLTILDLPPELRLMIYSYMYKETSPSGRRREWRRISEKDVIDLTEPITSYLDIADNHCRRRTVSTVHKQPLFQVNRLIRDEAMHYFWTRAIFEFQGVGKSSFWGPIWNLCFTTYCEFDRGVQMANFMKSSPQGLEYVSHIQLRTPIGYVTGPNYRNPLEIVEYEPHEYWIKLDISPGRRAIELSVERFFGYPNSEYNIPWGGWDVPWETPVAQPAETQYRAHSWLTPGEIEHFGVRSLAKIQHVVHLGRRRSDRWLAISENGTVTPEHYMDVLRVMMDFVLEQAKADDKSTEGLEGNNMFLGEDGMRGYYFV